MTLAAAVEALRQRHNLSQRQAEIVFMAVQGYSYAEIGDSLGITKRTVHEHATGVFRRTGARSMRAVVRVVWGFIHLCPKDNCTNATTTANADSVAER